MNSRIDFGETHDEIQDEKYDRFWRNNRMNFITMRLNQIYMMLFCQLSHECDFNVLTHVTDFEGATASDHKMLY